MSAEVDVQHQPAMQNNDKVENNMESLAIKFFLFSDTIIRYNTFTVTYRKLWLVLKTRDQAA